MSDIFVRISHDLSTTHKRFKTTATMKEMIGKIYKLGQIFAESNKCRVEGFSFDLGDVIIVDKEDKIKEDKKNEFLFDVNCL